jgi:hypothetical protein
MSDRTTPKVLFIGGYGRSGSTLLDRVVGGTDGFFSAGELRHIWQEGYVENRLCGCRVPFQECPFWAEVSAVAFDRFGGLDIQRLLEVKDRVDRYHRVVQLAADVAMPARQRDLRWYGAHLRALYEAIGAVSGADVIIDSSKDVSHGYVLRTIEPPIDLHVLHLVRDSRAVAWSWRRKKHNPGSGRDMDQYGLVRTSTEWVAINALSAGHRRLGVPYLRVHYEQLVSEPAATVGEILAFVGEGHRAIPVDEEGRVELTVGHTVAGNPNRFTDGPVAIRADDEWRDRMPRRDRAVVSALTLPVLAGYGFPR